MRKKIKPKNSTDIPWQFIERRNTSFIYLRNNQSIVADDSKIPRITRNETLTYIHGIFFIRGTTAPKSQDRLKRLLPDGSTGGLVVSKALSLNLNFSFLNRISLLLISSSYQLASRGWVDPVPDPILPEKFLGYSRESNPGPLGWQSDVLTTIPYRWLSRYLIL